MQQELHGVVGEAGLALIGWAWQRRAVVGPSTEQVVAGLPEGSHALALKLVDEVGDQHRAIDLAGELAASLESRD